MCSDKRTYQRLEDIAKADTNHPEAAVAAAAGLHDLCSDKRTYQRLENIGLGKKTSHPAAAIRATEALADLSSSSRTEKRLRNIAKNGKYTRAKRIATEAL
jgi:hypothetical protein